jgi:hypothetical protein
MQQTSFVIDDTALNVGKDVVPSRSCFSHVRSAR